MTLLDSGVTVDRNIGDKALLALTLERFPNAEVLNADDPFHPLTLQKILCFLRKILKANLIVIVSGGLFKRKGKLFSLRKIVTVGIARVLHKKIVVETQTFFLNGLLRILFKITFKGLTVPARDKFSLLELRQLGIATYRQDDLLLNSSQSNRKLSGVVVDSRCFDNPKIKSFLRNYLPQLKGSYTIVPTIHTDKHWRIIKEKFASSESVVCCSFHAAVFALESLPSNRILCVFDSEYYYRKFSVLSNVVKINLDYACGGSTCFALTLSDWAHRPNEYCYKIFSWCKNA